MIKFCQGPGAKVYKKWPQSETLAHEKTGGKGGMQGLNFDWGARDFYAVLYGYFKPTQQL